MRRETSQTVLSVWKSNPRSPPQVAPMRKGKRQKALSVWNPTACSPPRYFIFCHRLVSGVFLPAIPSLQTIVRVSIM